VLKQPIIRDKKHLKFLSKLPCVVCGKEGRTQAAHIRSGSQAGMGRKPSDSRAIPLCVECHTDQHKHNEKAWWDKRGGLDNAVTLAAILYTMTGDEDMARFEIVG
jgi:hypothetical protein